MKKSNIYIWVLSFIVLFQLLNIQPVKAQTKNLVGKWKSIKIDQKDVEINIDFSLDGSVHYEISTILKGIYLLKGNKLISYFTKFGTNNTVVDTSIIEISGNTLIQKSLVGGTTIKMTRMDKVNDNSKLLVGKWKSENYNGYQAITEYNSYFRVIVQLIVKSIKGTYTVNKNMITVSSKDTPSMRMNFKITGDTMTLHNLENGKDLTMVRVKK